MDVKLDNISMDLLGLRLTFKLPRISIKEQDDQNQSAEYHLHIEESQNRENEDQRMSYMEWKYGDQMNNLVDEATINEERRREVVKMRELPELKASVLKNLNLNNQQHQVKKSSIAEDRARMLRYDHRVINRLMTVDQISHIEQWLDDQPAQLADDEHVYDELTPVPDNTKDEDVHDSHHVDVAKSTNYYRDIANRDRFIYYKKVSIV